MTDFGLRKMTPDDLPEVLAIEKGSYPSPWTEEAFKAELAKPYSQSLVMSDEETDTRIGGYIVFWLMFDECQILNVAVNPEFRRHGLARSMIRKVVDIAIKNQIRRVVLNVRKSNMPAIQLYQSLNFTVVHVRKSFYSNGEDAYEMVLHLSGERVDF